MSEGLLMWVGDWLLPEEITFKRIRMLGETKADLESPLTLPGGSYSAYINPASRELGVYNLGTGELVATRRLINLNEEPPSLLSSYGFGAAIEGSRTMTAK
jgi:hypothetical protein